MLGEKEGRGRGNVRGEGGHRLLLFVLARYTTMEEPRTTAP